ncbi:MAG TPA: lipopolysaccharide heptosyltransferase II [Acidobacteriota bacterium]|nr:lipopolysaccharide heptosyltransferase II [Acidobacteriota bacterium]
MERTATGTPGMVVRATNWVGDVVMSLPALKELRRLFPNTHLAVVARKWVADLYRNQEFVDEVIVLPDGRSSLFLAPRLQSFECAVLFQNAFEAALLVRLARIPQRMGYAVQGRGWLLTHKVKPRKELQGKHQTFYYLDLLYRLGLSPRDYLSDKIEADIRLRVTTGARQELEYLLQETALDPERPLVALHPGAAYGPAKRWPAERFARLADLLQQKAKACVVLVGSEDELPLAHRIRSRMETPSVLLHGKTSLPGLLALFERCRLVITNDSGPMHLAAAVGTSQIALFGSTDETATGPLNPRARVIAKHPPCSPCFRRDCPFDMECFRAISVDEVWEAAQEILEGR